MAPVAFWACLALTSGAGMVLGVPPDTPLPLLPLVSRTTSLPFDASSSNLDMSAKAAPSQPWSKVGRGALSYIRSLTDLRQQSKKEADRATGVRHHVYPQHQPRFHIPAFRGLEDVYRVLLQSEDIQVALAQFRTLGKLLTFSEQTHEMEMKSRLLEVAQNRQLIVLTIDMEPLVPSVDGATLVADHVPHYQPAVLPEMTVGPFPKPGRQRASTISHPGDWRSSLGIIQEAAEKPWTDSTAGEILPNAQRPPFRAPADDLSIYGDDSSSISSDSSQFSIIDYAQFLRRSSYSDLQSRNDKEEGLNLNLGPLDQPPPSTVAGAGQGDPHSNRFGHTRSASSPQLSLHPPSGRFSRPKETQSMTSTTPKHPSVLRYSQLPNPSDSGSDSDGKDGEDDYASSPVSEQHKCPATYSPSNSPTGTAKLTRIPGKSDSSVCVADGANGLYTVRTLVDGSLSNPGDANQQYLWLHNPRKGIYLPLEPNHPDDQAILCKFRLAFGLSLGHTAINCL